MRETGIPVPKICLALGLWTIAIGLSALSAPGASAAQFYIQLKGGEEFHPIESTTEAYVESNGALEFMIVAELGGKLSWEKKVFCHATGVEKLYTNGTDDLEQFGLDTCSAGTCIVTPTTHEEEVYFTSLEEQGSPVVYLDDIEGPNFTIQLSGAACDHPVTRYFWPEETCAGTVDNTIFLELVLPESPAEGEGCFGSKLNTRIRYMAGRLRLIPSIGHALRVGP